MPMNVHMVIPDLFLPQDVAADACAGLPVPALEMLLARARPEPLLPDTLETWLCEMFGVADSSIAPVTLRADGMEPGSAYWLRVDPVHMSMQREQMILQADVPLSADEATQLCASLNAHFSAEGLRFFAPHPQRWYLQLAAAPDLLTRPCSQVAGKNANAHLPQGQDALRWHAVFNEIQMLFHEHAVNQAREARGELPVNSVWLWGGGREEGQLARPYAKVCGDSQLADAFAQVAGIPSAMLPDDARDLLDGDRGDVLLVWEGLQRALQHGDLHEWRDSLRYFEQDCAAPLLDALRGGRIAQLTLDVTKSGNPLSSKPDVELTLPRAGAARRFTLTRSAAWKLWRRPKPLARYALV